MTHDEDKTLLTELSDDVTDLDHELRELSQWIDALEAVISTMKDNDIPHVPLSRRIHELEVVIGALRADRNYVERMFAKAQRKLDAID